MPKHQFGNNPENDFSASKTTSNQLELLLKSFYFIGPRNTTHESIITNRRNHNQTGAISDKENDVPRHTARLLRLMSTLTIIVQKFFPVNFDIGKELKEIMGPAKITIPATTQNGPNLGINVQITG